MRPYVRVQHLEHDGTVLGTFFPLQPRFAFRANDVGDISYSVALSNPQVTRDAFAPKRTDFRLQVSNDGGFWRTIMAGFHWPVGFENETGIVNIQGMDWLAYLEQPMWFDLYNIQARELLGGKTGLDVVIDDPSKVMIAWVGTDDGGDPQPGVNYNATQQTVVQDLLDAVADGNDGTININAVFAGDGTGWSEVLNYVIMFQDETNVLDHIRAIANLDEPLGFDFFMNWDKSLVCYNPARTAPISSINTIYSITRKSPALVAVKWQNNGPLATHTVAVGEGSPGYWATKTFGPSVDTYRRWLRLVRPGGVYRMPKEIDSIVTAYPDRFPQKELQLTLKPDELEPTDATAFFSPMIGEALYVDIDFPPYHRINANFWIVGQEFHTDDAGNWLCDVSLEQIYDPSGVG